MKNTKNDKTKSKLKKRVSLRLAPINLMYPDGKVSPSVPSGEWENDLALGDVLKFLTLDKRYSAYVRQILSALITDIDIIMWRQATLADFLNNPSLVDAVEALLPSFSGMEPGNTLLGQRQRNVLLETSDRLAEIDVYISVVQGLYNALSVAILHSPALLRLRENLLLLLSDVNFQMLCDDLPALRAPLEKITSLTIGVNLDHDLRPTSAALMAINDFPIAEPRSFLEKLIGVASESEEAGIASLRFLPRNRDERILQPLFQDLDRLVTQVAQPVARALNQYARINGDSLLGLERELAFFAAAARLFLNLPFYCLPEIAPLDERITEIDGLASIHLLLRSTGTSVVTSDVDFGPDGRIAILTGPNSGGKTTYLRAIGMAHVLSQAGLAIPARRARISPIDNILTHFPALETQQQGRLAEEAMRLRIVFEHATGYSLVLLNETFSSTSPSEAVYLAQDILCGLRVIGVQAIYTTHLIELAQHIEEIERVVEGSSRVFSLIATVQLDTEGQTVRTFRIERGLPLGRSYALEIARLHGISLEQILAARP